MRLGQALAALAVSVVGVVGVSDSDAEHAAALMSNVSGRADDVHQCRGSTCCPPFEPMLMPRSGPCSGTPTDHSCIMVSDPELRIR